MRKKSPWGTADSFDGNVGVQALACRRKLKLELQLSDF
jgi:hypothetical protein